MGEAEYKLGYRGAANSNLAEGFRNLSLAVDGWIYDSDESNIDRLGHRRWCLNPLLRRVGFGSEGRFKAMYASDRSQRSVPDFDFVSFPARGLMPVELFNPQHAWNVTLHPRKYRRPAKAAVKPKVYEVDDLLNKVGEPLELNYFNVNNDPFGLPGCIIFRPAKVSVAPGKRYLVEIAGLRRSNGQPATVRFVVEFVRAREK
jgi:hypothetical protein